MEKLETRYEHDTDTPFAWRNVPAAFFAFFGCFLLVTSFLPWVNATFYTSNLADEQLATISRMLSYINAAGLGWLVSGWLWYRGRFWWAIIGSILGFVLLSEGLPDR